MRAGEKNGGNPISDSRRNKFIDAVNACNLMDLGFEGPAFAWTNLREGFANIKERIDKAFASPSWRHLFPEACIFHIPRTHSDHNPILINCSGILALRPCLLTNLFVLILLRPPMRVLRMSLNMLGFLMVNPSLTLLRI